MPLNKTNQTYALLIFFINVKSIMLLIYMYIYAFVF